MSGKTNIDRKTLRRQETQAEIIAAAWELVREDGLASLSMRDLGTRVGMRAQSIYSYFDSKHEIFDAMFDEGYRAFAEQMAELVGDGEKTTEPADLAKRMARAFVEFCTSDPVRHQLLFQRTIPGFTPSAESYAIAVDSYEQMRVHLATIGLADDSSLDLWTAVLTGLVDQQISNDPGGDRWLRLVDHAVDMLLRDARELVPARSPRRSTTTSTTTSTTGDQP